MIELSMLEINQLQYIRLDLPEVSIACRVFLGFVATRM